MNLNKINLLSFAVILLAAGYAYYDIIKIFFQQDEWLGLGNAIVRSEQGGIWKLISDLFSGFSPRFLPATGLTGYLVYSTFGLNFSLYGLLAFHLIFANACLCYLAIKKLTGLWQLGLAAALLLITNNNYYFSATWIGTMISSQFSLMFFLLSFYYISEYLSTKKYKPLIISTIFILISLTFKESSIFYFPAYLFLIWYSPDKIIKEGKRSKFNSSLIISIPFVIFVLSRLLFSSGDITGFSPASIEKDSAEATEISLIHKISYNAFLVPARSLSQSYFSFTKIGEWTRFANSAHYSNQIDGFVVESIIGDSFSLLVSFYMLLGVLAAVLISNNKNKRFILFSLSAFFLSTLPFIIFKNDATMLELRYYLFPSLWSGLLLVLVLHTLLSKTGKLNWILFFTIVVGITHYNSQWIKTRLSTETQTGRYRHEILKTVGEIEPELDGDIVLYFFTDHTGFYEFQSGFGQTLAVWLYDSGKIPRQALTDRDFWDAGYEGLKQFDERKYGYFMTYDKLLNQYQEDRDLRVDSLHAYYWDYQKHTVENVSDEIREKLKNDLML